MNSTSSRTAEAKQTRHGVYFFLSYAHSAPISERIRSDSDPSVGVFFKDLTEAVKDRARPVEGMEIGFFDQQIPSGVDLKTLLSEALGSAEVFVPLYSPGYFAKSWPIREQEVFRRRLRAASAVAPDEHIVPILWTPFPSWEQTPSVARALSIGANISEYGENGLRALCMLASYRRSYQLVLSRLADEIVTVAERSPLGPSAAPDLDDVPGTKPPAEAGFLVTMLAPRHGASRAPQAVKDRGNPWWLIYAGRRIPPGSRPSPSMPEAWPSGWVWIPGSRISSKSRSSSTRLPRSSSSTRGWWRTAAPSSSLRPSPVCPSGSFHWSSTGSGGTRARIRRWPRRRWRRWTAYYRFPSIE